jgi:hypothetical protein
MNASHLIHLKNGLGNVRTSGAPSLETSKKMYDYMACIEHKEEY